MKKGIAFIATLCMAQTISLVPGWQNVGTESFINVNVFNNECVSVVWKYDKFAKTWEGYSPDENIQSEINKNFSTLTTIYPNEGFWILANGECNISTVVTDDNVSVTDIQIDPNVSGVLNPGLENTAYEGVCAVDDYVYTVSRNGYLSLFKVDEPKSEYQPLKTLLIGDSDEWMTTLHVIRNGDYLYVLGAKFRVVDISDRENPKLIKTLDVKSAWNVPMIDGDKMIMSYDYGYDLSTLIDVSDKSDPKVITQYGTIGNTVLHDGYIYAVSNRKITKYKLNDDNNYTQVVSSDYTLAEDPFYIYVYNDKLVISSSSYIYLFDANTLELKNRVESSYSFRAAGCKDNICVFGSNVYDLNDFDNSKLTFSTAPWNADGFPYQVGFNDEGYVFRGSQEDVKVNKLIYGQ